MNYLKTAVISLLISCSSSSGYCSSSGDNFGSSNTSLSPNNTILQNLYALSLNSTDSNSTLSYVSLLLGLNTSCTTNLTQMLNSSDGNFTFFAPSDQAFKRIPEFPNFGPYFSTNCLSSNNSNGSSGTGSGGSLISRIFQSSSSGSSSGSCPMGCNDTSLALNASSPQLMACLPQLLQYHLLNSSLYFNSTSFSFLNRSSYNLTVLPTMLNSSCLVNLVNSTNNETNGLMGPLQSENNSNNNSMMMMQNNQVLVFNITNSGGSINNNNNSNTGGNANSASSSSSFNVTILHGINTPANVTIFDIPSSNGVLHVIDALLIPPANMTETINASYSSNNSSNSSSSGSSNGTMLPSFLNQTDLENYSNMSGITVFLPDMTSVNNTSDGNNTSSSTTNFNLTNYIFPSLLYNNRSFEVIGNLSDGVFFQQNLTNLNGENVTILFGRNNAMLFNGSRVTKSDVLMKNGVLHLFDASNSIFGSGDESSNNNNNNNTSAAASLGRILRQVA